MLAALDRHLKQNANKISIGKERKFVKCRQVLEGKARALREKATENDLMQLKHLFTVQDEELAMEISCTWRTKPKVTPLYSVVSAHPSFWFSRLPRAP